MCVCVCALTLGFFRFSQLRFPAVADRHQIRIVSGITAQQLHTTTSPVSGIDFYNQLHETYTVAWILNQRNTYERNKSVEGNPSDGNVTSQTVSTDNAPLCHLPWPPIFLTEVVQLSFRFTGTKSTYRRMVDTCLFGLKFWVYFRHNRAQRAPHVHSHSTHDAMHSMSKSWLVADYFVQTINMFADRVSPICDIYNVLGLDRAWAMRFMVCSVVSSNNSVFHMQTRVLITKSPS